MTTTQHKQHTLVWDEFEGAWEATDDQLARVIEIDALEYRAGYVAYREWRVLSDANEVLASGEAKDLRAAKRHAIAALAEVADRVHTAAMREFIEQTDQNAQVSA